MRIDSHVLYSTEHPPRDVASILSRNRFDGCILFTGDLAGQAFDTEAVASACVLGTVVPLEFYRSGSNACGISIRLPLTAGLPELALPVDVDMCQGHFPLLASLASERPSMRFVIDHMARPPFSEPPSPEWLRGIENVASLGNVYCKTSGLLTAVSKPWSAASMRPFVRHALAHFGPERVMFGSEWPASLPHAIWKETLAAFTQSIGAQTMEVREQLLGLNAQRFYGLT